MIQQLGVTGKLFLLNIINQSWKQGRTPRAWKNAHVVPILKKDKDPKELKSYRPISLTSCTEKEVSCNKALHADDLVIWHTHRHSRQSARYLERLKKYCDTWKITINTNKTSYSIFILSPKVTKQNLNIRLSDQQLKKEKHPSYLGVQLDPRLNLKKKHAANLKRKAMKRLSLIKRLASTSWGSDMDPLRSLYLGYVRSVLD
ncbi:retrovirus-related Pol polyprotein from type-1 retrotransposable element R1 4 [Elysia marginata]|uniref:Retrovirus-related Pol polyprotein from type-1 retrotransposable element R1 4 n=1 Tax=Elysia marginata TaxID=1093978 RepID=A0AAV4JSD7_9GAST|nr:retrovirus-related Pol polyprotein from type-1 retrotransposable element R1 4 [Elysia marginata]